MLSRLRQLRARPRPPALQEPVRLTWFTPARFLVALTALVLAYFAFTAVENLVQAYQIAREEERVRQDLAGVEQDYSRLTALKEYFASDEFVELMARQVLGWVRAGEVAVIAISPQQPAAGSSAAVLTPYAYPNNWWEAYFSQR